MSDYVPQGKQDFIKSLQHFVDTDGAELPDGYGRIGYMTHRGETTLVVGIIKYLSDPNIPDRTSGINWFVDLGKHLIEAFDEFRTDPKWDALRKAYEIKTGGIGIPSLTDVRDRDRTIIGHSVARLMGLVSGEQWLTSDLECRFNAEMQVIENAWRRFVCKARPLFKRIKDEDHRGNKGKFGKTTLMSYAMAGRVTFSFERDDVEVTAVCDGSDMYGCRSGLNWPSATCAEAISMIDEVTGLWDMSKFKADGKVGL